MAGGEANAKEGKSQKIEMHTVQIHRANLPYLTGMGRLK
jgi:hypothetical protein